MTVLEMLRELQRYPPEANVEFTVRIDDNEYLLILEDVPIEERKVKALIPARYPDVFVWLIDKGPREKDPVQIHLIEEIEF